MKQLIRLSLMLSVVGAHLIDNDVSRKPRRNRESLSNDITEMLTYETYNCEGMVLDWDLSNATDGLFTKVVEYDYDLLIEKGSDAAIALKYVQDILLRRVGKDIVSDCSRRLAVGRERQLDAMVIQEISSAPADTVSTSSSCKVEDLTFAAEFECYPVTGYITVYYSSSGDFGSDVSSIDQAVKDSVKNAIDSDALVTDTSTVHYLGDRETFSLDSPESSPSVASPDNDTSTPWWVILTGSSVGVLAIVLAAVLCYKKKNSPRKNNMVASVAPVEVSDENDYVPNELDEMETFPDVAKTLSEMTDEKEDLQAKCAIMPSGCEVLGCFNSKD
jgi:hypothetical protein